ncbi:glutathione S-transferas-like protein [Coniella lustricola]|uniref:Glutathione S-transferas-like protein n=1 Tax=Coniella lustricola TaxID=2025994 RepID=A0A2T3A9U1_9PEZI|nr:glutathione S-transferas-like protein [Coniella lustricola]
MSEPTITLYDIASGPPVRPFAPNPCKARYALNFKRQHNGVTYRTDWVDLSRVTEVRKSLGVDPVRKHQDNTDFYTLPVIILIGDSFDIAVYLDSQYPSRPGEPVLFPPSTTALHRVFNERIDEIFTSHVVLAGTHMPLNPDTAELSKAEFSRRAGGMSWEQMGVEGEARVPILKSFEQALSKINSLWYTRKNEGPFLEGAVPMYADLIVGGWLHMMKECLPEWEQLKRWDEGFWGQLHDALNRYMDKTD